MDKTDAIIAKLEESADKLLADIDRLKGALRKCSNDGCTNGEWQGKDFHVCGECPGCIATQAIAEMREVK